MGQRRSVDDGGGGNMVWGADGGRDSDLWEDVLDLIAHKHTLDKGSDEARLSRRLIAADTDPDCCSATKMRGGGGGLAVSTKIHETVVVSGAIGRNGLTSRHI